MTSHRPRSAARRTRPLAATLLVFTVLAALPAAADARGGQAWLHLAVDEAPPGSATVRVNLPVALVEAVLALVPEAEAREVRVAFDDTDVSLAELERAWRRLGNRSGRLLTVDEPERTTILSRRGGSLVIDSRDRRHGDDRVVVRIAAPVVDALLAGPGDSLDFAAAVRAMAAAGAGEVTARSDDGDRVRLWVDRSPEQNGESRPAAARSRR
jgi:hypothetical protein